MTRRYRNEDGTAKGTPVAAKARRRVDLRGRSVDGAEQAAADVQRIGERALDRRRVAALRGPRRNARRGHGDDADDARLRPAEAALRRYLDRIDDDPALGVRRI